MTWKRYRCFLSGKLACQPGKLAKTYYKFLKLTQKLFQSIIKTFFSDVEYHRSGSTLSDRGLELFWSSCVAAFPVLAPFGCFIGSKCAKKIGRRESLMINSALMILSSLMQTFSKPLKSYELFLLGRLLTGEVSFCNEKLP